VGRVKHTFQLVMASSSGIGLSLACVIEIIERSNEFVDLGPAASGWRGEVPYGECQHNPYHCYQRGGRQ